MQMLLKQSDVLDLLARFLPRRPEITKHLHRLKHESAETLPVYYKYICALILNATMTPTPSIEVRLYDGTALSVPSPHNGHLSCAEANEHSHKEKQKFHFSCPLAVSQVASKR